MKPLKILAILLVLLNPQVMRAEPVVQQSSTNQGLDAGPIVAASNGSTPLTGLLTGSTITATGGSSTTITSATSAGVGQYIKFAAGTTTVALQNVATWVTAVSGTGPYTLTVSPSLPASPTSTDTYNQANLGLLLKKNGGSWVPPTSVTISDAGLGYYTLTPSATDTGTLGRLMVHWDVYGSSAGISNEAPVAFVAAYNPLSSQNLGLTGVPSSGTALTPAGLPSDYLSGTEQTQLSTASTQASNAATSAAALPSATTTAAAIWNSLTASYTGAGTFGKSFGTVQGYAAGQDPATLLKADSTFGKLLAHNLGKFTYNTSTHILTLLQDDGTTVLGSVTLTVDGSGNITSRQ